MLINDTGQNETSRGVYFLVVDATGCCCSFLNMGNLSVFNQHSALENLPFIDNISTMD